MFLSSHKEQKCMSTWFYCKIICVLFLMCRCQHLVGHVWLSSPQCDPRIPHSQVWTETAITGDEKESAVGRSASKFASLWRGGLRVEYKKMSLCF